MMWTEVNFGKWAGKGKTLPQILVADPDWFFWAIDQKVFKGALAGEAATLARRASAIKLPSGLAATHCVQHWMTPDGKYSHFELIDKDQGAHFGSSSEVRQATLNLKYPRTIAQYDKLGCRHMINGLKSYWFDGKAFTKSRVETFFDDHSNFVNP
ncbi:MAG: hypothetical protein NXI18_13190 [Alphaproteobacteria bacterium]|nr:hypothetical protein [Alphaproteobacteria bacterium]